MAGLPGQQRIGKDGLLGGKALALTEDSSNFNKSVSVVTNLRAKLLDEARKERERCLRNPESHFLRGEGSYFADVAVQTELGTASVGWSQADEEAQAEAIQMIRRLSMSSGSCLREESSASGCQAPAADRERRLAVAARDQVKCLELELDNKESAIRVLERALESRDQELQATQLQVRRLLWREMEREKDTRCPPGADPIDYERIRALRGQVLELEYQLHLKDLEISRLSGSAPRCAHECSGAAAAPDEASTCGGSSSVCSAAVRSGSHSGGSSAAASSPPRSGRPLSGAA